MEKAEQTLIEEFLAFIKVRSFPCIAAKSTVARNQIDCMVAGDMACPSRDEQILHFLYRFVDKFRTEGRKGFASAAIIFRTPVPVNEARFDKLLWQRLQALSDMDAGLYAYDPRVDSDVSSTRFSFSLKEEAFFIVGMHPGSVRPARRFSYPTLVFNPHAQFELLRQQGKYETMKKKVRKRDQMLAGSVNPMLVDFGKRSEVFQYSGREYDKTWTCPLKIKHGRAQHHSTP